MVFYQEQHGVNITSVLSRQEYVSANCLLASVRWEAGYVSL
jgi:hypothetical protein